MLKEPTVTIIVRESLFDSIRKMADAFDGESIRLLEGLDAGKVLSKEKLEVIFRNAHLFATMTKEALVKR
jgi:hypothetical protein